MAVQPLRDLRDLPPEQPDESLPVDPALCAELDRRWELHQQNPEQAIAWDEVQQRLGL